MNAHTIDKPARASRRGILRWLGVVSITLAVGTASAAINQGAATDANVELTLLHGTKASASAIPSGWAELTQPPFDAYNHYDSLSTKTLALKLNTPTKESLPNGSSFEATLVATTPKVKIDLVFKDAKGTQISKGTYTSPKGKRFLPASMPYKGGALVVAFKVL